jgi:hypothetical protein
MCAIISVFVPPLGPIEVMPRCGGSVVLYRIARTNLEDPLDREYLDARIRYETAGSYDLRFLVERADEADDA